MVKGVIEGEPIDWRIIIIATIILSIVETVVVFRSIRRCSTVEGASQLLEFLFGVFIIFIIIYIVIDWLEPRRW